MGAYHTRCPDSIIPTDVKSLSIVLIAAGMDPLRSCVRVGCVGCGGYRIHYLAHASTDLATATAVCSQVVDDEVPLLHERGRGCCWRCCWRRCLLLRLLLARLRRRRTRLQGSRHLLLLLLLLLKLALLLRLLLHLQRAAASAAWRSGALLGP